ncbi:MAG: hypothetical protein DMD43_08590 [Gemmatimonadetes bacterium]|nr:MAG: hypothetical protein DMD43_08590 [Gemmatimonadota bacterium]
MLAQNSGKFATVEVRAGYTKTSKGDASDLAAGQSLKGQSSFGAGAFIALGSRLHAGLTADWAHHSVYQVAGDTVIGGAGDEQWNILHTFVKLRYDLVAMPKWTVAVNGGGGLMIFSPDSAIHAKTGNDSEVHFGVNGGATITWWFSDRIGIMASPQADIAFKKTAGRIFTNKSATTFPITGGFQFKI